MRRTLAMIPALRARVLRVLAGVALAAGLVGAGATPSVAATARTPADPRVDARADAIRACTWSEDDSTTACLLGALHQFDEGLKAEGRRTTFALPSTWTHLTPAQQLFVLADEDRVTRGLPPIAGMNACLTRDAASGAKRGTDPGFACRDPFRLAGGNWSGANSPLYSEWLFVYDDGPDGPNADCTPTDASGCWGHRHNVLAAYGTPILMGAADSVADREGAWRAGAGGGEAEEFYGDDTAAPSFTWQQLQPAFAHPITEASLLRSGACIAGRTDALSCTRSGATGPALASARPAQVARVHAAASHGTTRVTWAAPRSLQRVDGYQVAVVGTRVTRTHAARTTRWQGAVSRGRWSVRVRAHDAAGWGAWSTATGLTVP